MQAERLKSDASTTVDNSAPRQSRPRLVIPDHELIRCIGEGADGEVWLARNVLGGYRAVKAVFRATFKTEEPYEREFRGIQRFEPISRSSDGLVDILQVGRNDAEGCFYYVMELADDAAEPQASVQCSVICNQFLTSETQAASGPLLKTDHCSLKTDHCSLNTDHCSLNTDHCSLNTDHYEPKTLRSETHRRVRLPPEECVHIGLNLTLALAHLLVQRETCPRSSRTESIVHPGCNWI